MKTRLWSILCILIYMLILVRSPAGAQVELLFEEGFESGDSGWELDPGWRLEELTEGAVLQGEGHNWARLGRIFPADFELRFRIRLLQGRVHIVTHLNDQGRYFIGLGGGPASLNKQYWPDRFLEDLAVAGQEIPGEMWAQVEIFSSGGEMRLSVDGEQLWTYSDPDPLGPGGIAFETLEGASVQVDDILLYGAADREGEPEAPAVPGTDLTWVRTGGPLGGLGYDVRMHPENPDKMYVTDAFAGVFISEDGGRTWHPSNEGITDRAGDSMDAIPVFCLSIDPREPQIVWVGTQYSGGLFKSEDGGESWARKVDGISLQSGLTFRGISFDPTDSQTMFAAGEISSWAWADEPRMGREFDLTQGVVYKSEDGGETWREVWRGDNLARYVWVNPENPRVVYVSTGIFDREAANSDPISGEPGGEGVLKSTDGGETWVRVNEGLDNLYVGSLYMHPEDPDVLLAGTGNIQYWERGGVYLTTDGADSWTRVHGEELVNVNSVEISESDPQIAYAGGDAMILRSQDGGRNWIKVSQGEEGWGAPGVRGGFPIDFQVDPRDPERLFANNYGGGNFLSEDGGRTWAVASHGYTGAQVRALAVDPQEPGRVYAAARSGVFVSGDGGGVWRGLARVPNRVLEWNAVAVDPLNPEHLLAGNNWQGAIMESWDAGHTWEVALPLPGGPYGVRAVAFSPSQPERIFAGTGAYYSAGVFSPEIAAVGIYRSVDGGTAWEQSTQGEFSDAHVLDISVAREDGELVYAATSNYGVIRSSDGGGSWEQTNEGLRMRQGASAIAIHPEDPEIVYAGVAFGGVYGTMDGGRSWRQISAGMNPEANITDLAIDPSNPAHLYAADFFSGVYRSLDGGEMWERFSQGLRMRAVGKLALSADGRHLYAATEGEGVYRMDLAGEAPPQASSETIIGAEPDTEPTDAEPAQEPTPAASDPDSDESRQAGSPNRFCAGSYLPLVLSLAGYASWARRKRSELNRR